MPYAVTRPNLRLRILELVRVLLRHYDLPDDEQRDHHGKGWQLHLERLGVLMLGGDPGPDPNA